MADMADIRVGRRIIMASPDIRPVLGLVVMATSRRTRLATSRIAIDGNPVHTTIRGADGMFGRRRIREVGRNMTIGGTTIR